MLAGTGLPGRSWPPEDEPDAPHVVQQPALALGLRLAAQVAHVDVERVGSGPEVVAPDPVVDLGPAEDLVRVPEEQLEEGELGAGEGQLPLAAPGPVLADVEAEVLEGEAVGGAATGPPEQGPYTGQQLIQGERLEQVVVGAGVEAGDPIGDLGPGGEE